MGGIFLAKPSLHTTTQAIGDRGPHTGTPRPTAWLGRVALGPCAQGGGRPRIPLRTELSSLWLCWGLLLLDPHARALAHTCPILYLLLPLPFLLVDVSGWDPLHPQHFPDCSRPGFVPESSVSLLPPLPWEGEAGPVF